QLFLRQLLDCSIRRVAALDPPRSDPRVSVHTRKQVFLLSAPGQQCAKPPRRNPVCQTSSASPSIEAINSRSYASIPPRRGRRLATISTFSAERASPGVMTIIPIAIVTSGLRRSRKWFSFVTLPPTSDGGLRNLPKISVHVTGKFFPART